MRRFLVVGCGGSGGATLAYLMDQLRSDLAALHVDKLPRAWQFVHIDVPHSAESGPSGLGNVEEQGGTYISAGAATSNYKVLDDAVSNVLTENQKLDKIGSWAPRRPKDVLTPTSVGAGQFRAVGRMITLSRVLAIRAALETSWNQLNHPDTRAEMRTVRAPLLQGHDDAPPIVLVVSSMAGGAGASMALDVCRLLTSFSGPSANMVGVFMVAPNIFDRLPEASRRGVRPNALAMLGEIVASQTGAAMRHDMSALTALGLPGGEGELAKPFARVFPVGRFAGTDRTQFGDGSPNAVYRGLGRGLAGMMMSPTATMQFQSYDLGNTASLQGERDLLGWGADWESLLWGSYGYASLSMGRDRYAEYSAQRIAASCVDRLLNGHKQPTSRATSLEQVETLLDGQWAGLCNRAGLPASDAEVKGWLHNYAVPTDDVNRETGQAVRRHLEPQLPLPRGQAEQWVTAVRQRIRDAAPQLTTAAETIASQRVYAWHTRLRDAVEQEIDGNVAGIGLPYAAAAVDRLGRHIRNLVAPGAERIAAGPRPNLAAVPDDAEKLLSGLRGTLNGGNDIVLKLLGGCQKNLRRHVEARSAELVAALVRQFSVEVLEPLQKALTDVQTVLERASTAPAVDLGLARLSTDQPIAWPRDDDERVPDRFDEADNEVLLTSSADFPRQYVADMQRAIGSNRYFQDARAAVVAAVVSGRWKTAGGEQAPGGLLEVTAEWRPALFPFHPDTRQPIIPVRGAYDVHVRPAEVLARARRFVARTGESFDEFCRLSITDYVKGVGAASEAEADDRRTDIVAKFEEALTLARPLISVNGTALQAVHPRRTIEYRYKFSEVPFRDVPGVANSFVRVLETNQMIDQPSRDNLGGAIGGTQNITRIDVFGSYPNYSPLVFDAVLGPVAEQWAGSNENGREDFWRWRRARPLDAALPMGDAERRTMVAGWLLGLVVGRIRIPAAPYTKPVQVLDAARREWVDFPHPLLTPPRRFVADYDWLPAVLESVLIAIARSHEAPAMASLRPYRVLRHIFDSSTEEQAGGMLRHDVAARRAITEWLAGVRGAEGASAVAGVTPDSSVEERAKFATGWLTDIRTLAGRHYMAPGERSADPASAPGGGTFSVIDTRDKAARTPMFRDLAPDVFWATGQLISMIEECREQAQRPRPADETPSWPDPSPAEIEIPPGQNF